jgi:hypothetical protein
MPPTLPTLPPVAACAARGALAFGLLAGAVAGAPGPASAADEPVLARVAIEYLLVKGRAPKTGYSRQAFGPAWADVDRNGCDTRNDILKRDFEQAEFKPRTRECVVLWGVLRDPYSGEVIVFERGDDTSAFVQVDHVVSLSNAWQTGMFRATPDDRRAFGNDPLNLLAVKGALNQQKGDADAATWLPPVKGYRCQFVARQIAVKRRYNLWLTRPEKDAMLRVLKNCPGETLPGDGDPASATGRDDSGS